MNDIPTPNPTQIANQLRTKPSLGEAQSQYQAIVRQMADHIAALTPGTTWKLEQNTWDGCTGKYDHTSAKNAYLMAVFNNPVPDEFWPHAVQIVKDGAAQIGAHDFGVFKDNPGDHDIYVAGADGIEFRFGTQKAAVLTAKSDCRLKQSDINSR